MNTSGEKLSLHTEVRPRIFKITQNNLFNMFKQHDDPKSDRTTGLHARLEQLNTNGFARNIMLAINTESATGISGDRKDIERRKAVYGENVKPLKPQSSFVESFKEEVRNLLWIIIFVTGAICTICGLYEDGGAALLGGIFLFMFGIIMILITSAIDYFKDGQFIKLQSFLIDEQINVIRGKFGSTETISIWDLVVGDIIMMHEGDRVPADCLVLESADFCVDEEVENKFRVDADEDGNEAPKNGNIELDQIPKGPNDDGKSNFDPFVRADSLITRGTAKLLVCCTGKQSTRSNKSRKIEDDTKGTDLQVKLDNLGAKFTKLSIIACLIILVELIIMSFVRIVQDADCAETNSCKDAFGIVFNAIPKSFNIAAVLIVVAVPEGLPLTIGVSLAFSVMRMYRNDRIFLKRQDSLEKIAKANEFIVGKTNILTTGRMKVKQFYIEGQKYNNDRNDTLFQCELNDRTIQLIKDGILYNNSSYVEMGERKFVPVGNGTEVGLLKFLQNADIPIHTLIRDRFDTNQVLATVPLRSNEGKFFTACAVLNNGMVQIHIKGAPQCVVPLADYHYGVKCTSQGLDPSSLSDIRSQFKAMASAPLRVIAFAHCEISHQDWESEANGENLSANQKLAYILDRAVFKDRIHVVGALGLQDNVRPKAASALRYTMGTVDKDYKINKQYDESNEYLVAEHDRRICVRMVTGDAKATAAAVAIKVGLIQRDQLDMPNVVMNAEQFDQEVSNGNLVKVLTTLRVLSNATPEHRRIITQGLREQLGKVVAVTGSGLSDVDALHQADVGLALGSGCSAAKEVSDMVLTDDDFEASLRAVMWGRNIYHNVARFLQFQVTVNLSCLLIVFFGTMLLGESPFSAVQLLWINLVMDTFAAFALGTEPPLQSVIDGPPFNDTLLMRGEIWRQIIGMSLWNFIVIMCTIIFVPLVSDQYVYSFSDSAVAGLLQGNPTGDAKPGSEEAKQQLEKFTIENGGSVKGAIAKLQHMTLIFHIFVFLQLFNQINCRKDGKKEYNVFSNLFHNKYFILVLVGEFAFQFLFPSVMIQTWPVGKREMGGCLMVGATPLLIAILLKSTPLSWLKFFEFKKFIDENKKTEDNVFNRQFERANNAKVSLPKKSDDGYKPLPDSKDTDETV